MRFNATEAHGKYVDAMLFAIERARGFMTGKDAENEIVQTNNLSAIMIDKLTK